MMKPKLSKLFKCQIIIDDDFCRVNVYRVIYNNSNEKTNHTFTDWKDRFNNIFHQYKKQRKIDHKKKLHKEYEHDIILQDFYFRPKVFQSSRDCSHQVKSYIKHDLLNQPEKKVSFFNVS